MIPAPVAGAPSQARIDLCVRWWSGWRDGPVSCRATGQISDSGCRCRFARRATGL